MQFVAEGLAGWDPTGLIVLITFTVIATIVLIAAAIGVAVDWDFSPRGRIRGGVVLGLMAIGMGSLTVILINGMGATSPREAFVAEAQRVYDIPLSGDVAEHLLLNEHGMAMSLGWLAQGGAEQMVEHYGTAEFLVDDERYNLSLAWVADEWVLLEGDPADLNELERVAGS